MKAFPSLYVHFNNTNEMSEPRLVADSHHGMDLRDYFAAKVLPKMIDGGFSPSNAATYSYEFADAMMKARGK
jgi:hypothetical protein